MDAHMKCEHATKKLCTNTCVPNVVRGLIIKCIIKSMQIAIMIGNVTLVANAITDAIQPHNLTSMLQIV